MLPVPGTTGHVEVQQKKVVLLPKPLPIGALPIVGSAPPPIFPDSAHHWRPSSPGESVRNMRNKVVGYRGWRQEFPVTTQELKKKGYDRRRRGRGNGALNPASAILSAWPWGALRAQVVKSCMLRN